MCNKNLSRSLSASGTRASGESKCHQDNVSLCLLTLFLHVDFSLSRSIPFLSITRLPDSEKPWGHSEEEGREERDRGTSAGRACCSSGMGLWTSSMGSWMLTALLPACPAKNHTYPWGWAQDPAGMVWAGQPAGLYVRPTLMCVGTGNLGKSRNHYEPPLLCLWKGDNPVCFPS